MELTLTKRGDYLVRAAICLARAYGGSDYCKIREVAEAMELPRSYTPQILGVLVQAGWAEAKAGREGGYWLRRDPARISLLEWSRRERGRCARRGARCGAGPADGTTCAPSTLPGRRPPGL